ncbi:SurA N-terminal domain-containing protein [soil metagenome]
MAVINKIRSKATLLIGIVGFSLAAFILGDLFNSNHSILKSNDSNVGVIGGNKIAVQDFENRVQKLVTNHKLNNNVETVDQNTMDQLREQAWSQLVNDEVMQPQFDKIGITVSSDELFDMVKGKNPHPQIKQAFTDPKTGKFDPANVINFLKNMDNDATGRTKAQWLVFEDAIQQERVQQKYNDLIKQGIYITTLEAKADYLNKARSASVRYVSLPYSSISDSSVQVTDAELKTVYNANLKKYKQVASRAIEYVTFDVNPTDIDRKASFDDVNKIVADFRTATNDSAFVALNSDSPFDATYHKKGSLPLNIDSIMFSAPAGTVFGPYEEGGAYKVAKLSDSKMLPDSVKASHILLRVDNPANQAKVMLTADSIKTALKGGANFEALSNQYSTDEGSKSKGGDLGWFQPGMMVKEFNDACFSAAKGDLLIVQTQFGIHIINVVDIGKESRQVRVAYVSRKIEASTKTYQAVYTKANEFASKNTTAEAFDKAVKDQNLNKLTETNITESSRQIGPLENSRELVRWSFNAKMNEISKAFEFGNRFTIAKLTDAREKGYSTMEQVKDQVTAEARKDKKAEMLMEKLKKAGSSNLDAIATGTGTQVQVAENVSFATPYIGSAGMEGNVVGHILTMKPGTVSAPLKGQSGVFVVVVNSFTEPTAQKDYKENAAQLRQQIQARSQYEVFNALRDKADIDDRRGKFY